jgi:hypothetical protein
MPDRDRDRDRDPSQSRAGSESPWPIPPGTPEARAAIERVKRMLAEEDHRKPVVTGRSRGRGHAAQTCETCGRRVVTPGETRCWRHRG